MNNTQHKLIYQHIINNSNQFATFDVIKHNEHYYAGFDLANAFDRYLAKSWYLSVMEFNNETDAIKYAKNINF